MIKQISPAEQISEPPLQYTISVQALLSTNQVPWVHVATVRPAPAQSSYAQFALGPEQGVFPTGGSLGQGSPGSPPLPPALVDVVLEATVVLPALPPPPVVLAAVVVAPSLELPPLPPAAVVAPLVVAALVVALEVEVPLVPVAAFEACVLPWVVAAESAPEPESPLALLLEPQLDITADNSPRSAPSNERRSMT